MPRRRVYSSMRPKGSAGKLLTHLCKLSDLHK